MEFFWQEGYVVDNNQLEHTIVKQKLLHLDSFFAEYGRVVERMKSEPDDKERERKLKRIQIFGTRTSIICAIGAVLIALCTLYWNITHSIKVVSMQEKIISLEADLAEMKRVIENQK